MDYLKNLQKLHESANEILEKMIFEQKRIESLEAHQNNFKETFGNISPQFSFNILVAQRKIKMLRRGYFKINDQINNLKITLTFIQLSN